MNYINGFYMGSILCSSCCVEYALKYEYLRRLPKSESVTQFNDQYWMLGFFTKNNGKALKKLKLKSRFFAKIKYLQNLRNGFFHFNAKRLSELSNKEKDDEFKGVIPSDEFFHHPRFAYRAYIIMKELLTHLYGEHLRKKYLQECIMDADKRKKEALKDMEKNNPWHSDMSKPYIEKKLDHYKKEFNKRFESKK